MATASQAAPALRSSMLGVRLREAGWGYGFVAVPIVVFGLFFIYPFGYALYISFFHWGILGKQGGAEGTFNYSAVLHDPIFHIALKNIAEYTIGVVPLEMALGLSLALVINQKIRGRNFVRSAFYFPSIASSVAITTIALYIFNSDGLFNRIIGSHTPWFHNAGTVLWAIVGLNAWTTSGTVMLYYLAGLQAISTDVYEAAALDNTSAWRTFWKITFPLLRPAHFFVLVVFGIGALKLFDQAFIVGGGSGGPNNSTQTPVLYIYRDAFSNFDFGKAAAAGIVLFVIIFVLTLVQRMTVGRQEAA
ncbi:MAG TPA: sugar ABC transporter permease [Gaiellaceae bacterium]|jgi:multiple sugar transport system permease protein|nr:sugar ABC transporter permease [Gaiellaceae bacterium]